MTISTFPKRILIRPNTGIGDLVMLLPVLHTIKNKHPDTEITVHISRAQSALAGMLRGTIDHTMSFVGDTSSQKYANFISEVRDHKFDLYVDVSVQYSIPIPWFSLAKKDIFLDMRNDPLWRKIFKHGQIPHSSSPHQVTRQLDLLEHLGLPKDEISFDVPIKDEYVQDANKTVEKFKLQSGMVAIIPESSEVAKDMPREFTQDLINLINCDFGRKVVLFGKNEGPQYLGNVADLRAETSFPIDTYLLRAAKLFATVVGADTGMMHIAGSVNSKNGISSGNKTISLFGPTDPEFYAPYDSSRQFNIVVTPPQIDYLSFRSNGFANDRTRRNYMTEIPLEKVVEALERQLSD